MDLGDSPDFIFFRSSSSPEFWGTVELPTREDDEMTNAVRDQIRGRRSRVSGRVNKASVRQDLNRAARRQARQDLYEGYEPNRTRRNLDYVLA